MNQDWVNDWHRLGAIGDIPPGTSTVVRAGGIDLAVFNVNGECFALADACAECGQALNDARVDSGGLTCASCGRRIHLSTCNDESKPSAFPVMVVDDEIFVLIENDA